VREYRKWTDVELKFLRVSTAQGATTAMIARHLGRPGKQVDNKKRELQLTLPPRRHKVK
jgi:hypothetical protein